MTRSWPLVRRTEFARSSSGSKRLARRIAAAFAFVLFAVAVQRAYSATFGTKPASLTIDPRHPIAQVAVSSLNARVVSFDVRVHRWTQNANADVLGSDEPAGLIVVPPIFSIAPFDTTLVRVAFRQTPSSPKVEDSYQVVMTEITPSANPPARVITVPLFIRPATSSGEALYTLRPAGGNTASLIINNQSNAHIYVSKLSISLNGETLYNGKFTMYVLAGTARSVPLTLRAPLIGARADLRFENEDGASQSAQAIISR